MCSKFALQASERAFAEAYGTASTGPFEGEFYSYRLTKSGAPAKPYSLAPAIVQEESGERTLHRMRWGLVSTYARTDQDMPQPFSARTETIRELNQFKNTLQHR